jgi:glutamate N-acetyltransferase / amino-acid N-acetyltransferase
VNWPEGFSSAATSCGIRKSGRVDLAALVATQPVEWAGTFTRNAAAAAPVKWCRSRLGQPVRGVVVNSGNANACTGSSGPLAVEEVAGKAATEFDCDASDLLIASTGPIGVALPVENIIAALPNLASSLGADSHGFAEAILTTDTKIKRSSAQAGDATITGVAKGSAMLAPNMATMLAFVATDAILPPSTQDELRTIVDRTFNCVSVDECESTNDSVFLLGSAQQEASESDFINALTHVCGDLAEQMARDAEGGTKLVRINVNGADTDEAAHALAKGVAASVLWRAAVNGADPNWGRILAALGSVNHALDLSRLTVAIGPDPVFAEGEPIDALEATSQTMSHGEFTVTCTVGSGSGSAKILSVDLSPEYVEMNAGGLT